jgi:hypothetical protein
MTTLSGRFGGAIEALADTLADTPEFRVWTTGGTYDPDAARTPEEEATAHAAAYARVHFFTQRDTGFTLPAALVGFGSEISIIRTSAEGGYAHWPTGGLYILFKDDSSTSNDTALHEGIKAFADDILGIVEGMFTTVKGDTEGKYLQFISIQPEGPNEGDPFASDKRQGDGTNTIEWLWSVGVRS